MGYIEVIGNEARKNILTHVNFKVVMQNSKISKTFGKLLILC